MYKIRVVEVVNNDKNLWVVNFFSNCKQLIRRRKVTSGHEIPLIIMN